MDGWMIGLIALFVVGLAVIGYGGISDRRRHRRAVAEMLSPPPRTIPHLPADGATPRYLSSLQAHRTPNDARPELSAELRKQIDREIKQPATVTVPVGFASDRFVTDATTQRAILDDARILASAEPIMNIRELISVIEHMTSDATPLVVVAPAMAPDVLDTLEVNHIQRKLDLVVVLTRNPGPVDMITRATGANLISRVDLQTGYLADRDLGRCRRWVSDRRRSHIIAGPTSPDSDAATAGDQNAPPAGGQP